MGKIYRLRSEFYISDPRNRNSLTHEALQIRTNLSYSTDDEIIEKYFEPHAVASLEWSRVSDSKYSDLFLVGYQVK